MLCSCINKVNVRKEQWLRNLYASPINRAASKLPRGGPVGWGITPFEGNYYIGRKYLLTDRFKPNFIPGICIYKFLYVWMDFQLDNGKKSKFLGWFYWLPNPLFPFIWYRIGLPHYHPEILIEEFEPIANPA